MNHGEQQQKGASQHHNTLHSIVQHAGTKAAESGIDRNGAAEDDQAGIVGNAGSRLQQPGPANKLYGHGTNKGHQQAQAGQPNQQRAAKTRIQHVVQRNGIMPAGKNGKFFAEDTQRQPDGRHLHHRQQHPAKTIFIGRTGPTNKGACADISGG